ncbi:Crp/Fnr family transcriptional regulator [Novosphingobium sp. Gsoil 351]|uniref:Crp/Fnr family transcriptional regulator n=1 Tax=Novosphingobium sp. Gsoil 351 TaxID=2675225 RepID=UPI001E5E2A2A|nr:Crp/Fnr family transcriptional regulator [Novosphingobium sp. Gsoil 351]
MCPLAACRGLRPLDAGQVAYMERFKQGELSIDRGTQVLVQGQRSAHVFTVLEGVLIRFKLLEDGRRQIVNFMFPGDLIGLQAAMGEPLTHGVEALTSARLCVFARGRFPELIQTHPELGYDVIWLAAKEEEALEEHLVALGQRTARERIAYLAVFLVQRAMETGLAHGNSVALTVTQTQIADMLGLSLVHTNRTLQALRQSNLITWNLSEILIADMDAAREFTRFDHTPSTPRPYL